VATKAAEGARKAKEKLDAAASENKTDPEKIAELTGEARNADEAAEKSKRRAAKARVKAEVADREADTLTGADGSEES
jgi:hypothetical protein